MGKTRNNRPFDFVHDIYKSYGRLVIPLARGRWLMLTEKWKWSVVQNDTFHNCTATGKF